MTETILSVITFVFTLAGALLGLFLRGRLPDDDLSGESRTVVTMGMGLVVTMAALVLGLLISSAKNFYDTQYSELSQMSANITLVDRLLAHYGPQANEARSALREDVGRAIKEMWPESPTDLLRTNEAAAKQELFFDKLQELTPLDDVQRELRSQAISIAVELGRTRRLMIAQSAFPIPMPLLTILISWLVIIYASFSLYAPRNPTVLTSLFVSGFVVSTAVLLILEMYTPYHGLIQVSRAPLEVAFERLGH